MTSNGRANPDLRCHRVLLVEDHAVVREGIAQLLALEQDFEVCGQTGDARQVLDAIDELRPDVVLVDLRLGGLPCFELIRNISTRHEHVPVLVLSVGEEAHYARPALDAGAMGYVMKTQPSDVVLEALRMVLRGQEYLSPQMMRELARGALGRGPKGGVSPVEALTPRQYEVFVLIGHGLTTRQIAQRLHVSVATIESHRANIQKRLGLHSGNELTVDAIRWVQEEGVS